jgi:hypothetical protein
MVRFEYPRQGQNAIARALREGRRGLPPNITRDQSRFSSRLDERLQAGFQAARLTK